MVIEMFYIRMHVHFGHYCFRCFFHRAWGFCLFSHWYYTLHSVCLPPSYLYSLEDSQTPRHARSVCVCVYIAYTRIYMRNTKWHGKIASSFHHSLLHDTFFFFFIWENTLVVLFLIYTFFSFTKAIDVQLRVQVWANLYVALHGCVLWCCHALMWKTMAEGNRWRVEAPRHCLSSNRCWPYISSHLTCVFLALVPLENLLQCLIVLDVAWCLHRFATACGNKCMAVLLLGSSCLEVCLEKTDFLNLTHFPHYTL